MPVTLLTIVALVLCTSMLGRQRAHARAARRALLVLVVEQARPRDRAVDARQRAGRGGILVHARRRHGQRSLG